MSNNSAGALTLLKGETPLMDSKCLWRCSLESETGTWIMLHQLCGLRHYMHVEANSFI